MTRDDVVALLARREDAINRRDWATYRALHADDARLQSPLVGPGLGPDAFVHSMETFFTSFPDAVVVVQPPIVDGNRAMQVADVKGTHLGAFMGLPPSGRAFRFLCVFILVFRDDRIVEEQRIWDFTGVLVQIGVLKAKPA